MNKSSFVKIIITLCVLAAFSAIMVIGATLAWFVFKPEEVGLRQDVTGSWYEVSFDEYDPVNPGYIEAKDIDIRAYPVADSKIAQAKPEENIYRFRVENVGTIDIIYRFEIKIEDDAGGENLPYLSGQLCYSLRRNKNDTIAPASLWSAPMFVTNDASRPDNVSLQNALDNILVNPDKTHTEEALLKGRTNDRTGAGAISYYEICIWLHQSATQESCTYIEGGVKKPKTAQLSLLLHAKQLYADAIWDNI